MHDLIQRMRQFDAPFNPPASPEQLAQLEKALHTALSDELRTLYLDHDGMPGQRHQHPLFPMRLMPVDEALTYVRFEENWQIPDKLAFFWTDDNLNFAGINLSGVLKGRVFLVDYETLDFGPRFRSVRSFVQAMVETLEDANYSGGWFDVRTDYPLLRDVPETDVSDLLLAEHFMRLYEKTANDDVRLYYADCVMNLLPFAARDRLLRFIQDKDERIIVHACDQAGLRRYEPALPVLFDAIRTRAWECKIRAVWALGKIGTPEAKRLLFQAVDYMPGNKRNILFALKEFGYETKDNRDGMYYREPGSQEWLRL